MSVESLNQKIRELYEEYKNDEYILFKLIHHINHDLETMLINAKKQQKSREDRRLLLTEGRDKFISEFLNKNTYFYCSTTEIFFKYDQLHYSIIKEDDIIFAILSVLNRREHEYQSEYYEQQLQPWKFRIKNSAIKQLRDISVFTSIPESPTIQYVINLFLENFFETRNEVKYFLTIMGDTILKKTNSNVYLISPVAKPLLRLLENEGGKYFGHIPLQNSFRYKYYDHAYKDCRLVNIKNVKSNIEELLEKIVGMGGIGGVGVSPTIDTFVVCCYYSNRYGNADEYLNYIQDIELRDHVLYLKNNDQNAIVDNFIGAKIQASSGSMISMKNMLYLWKCYLDENNISGVLFHASFKALIKEKLGLKEGDSGGEGEGEGENGVECGVESENKIEYFHGYTSLGLPLVSNFIKFWDTSMKENMDEYYLEIDEICILFKQWLGGKSPLELKETNILNLIKHFYPDIIIENDKYIYGISCSSWNKKADLNKFLSNHENLDDLTAYELYVNYTKKNNKKNTNLVVNKSYFDLFITEYNEHSSSLKN